MRDNFEADLALVLTELEVLDNVDDAVLLDVDFDALSLFGARKFPIKAGGILLDRDLGVRQGLL
jgi:hypothetical protein